MEREISKLLKLIKSKYGYPDIKILESAVGPEVVVGGKKILMMGSYNYLGLANNLEVKKRAIEIINKYGVGTGGVRLLTGTMDIHIQMEKMVSELTGHDDCVTIASGFGTNSGIIPAVVNLLGFDKLVLARKAVIFSDEYNHASIVDGCRLSNAETVIFKHNNIIDLEKKIKKYRKYRKLIITDGVFSMDGDIAPLDKIIDIAMEYDAMTMVDDAHSIGVLGERGSGTAEYYNRRGQIDLNMGTFSKGLGVSGGFVSCNKEMAEYLRIACRSHMFSDSLSPALVGAIMGVLEHLKDNPDIRIKLKDNADYFRNGLKQLGFHTFNSITQVVPLLVGDDKKTINFYNELFDNGIFAPVVRWPAVPKKTGRIRFSIMATHEKKQLDYVLNILEKLGKKFDLI